MRLRLRIAVEWWLFRHLFPGQAEHMQHLVNDVVRLEGELRAYTNKGVDVTYWSACKTRYENR